MAHEKMYTAKQVAQAILEKAKELLNGSKALEKSEDLTKYETSNSKKLGYKLPDAGKDEKLAEQSDKGLEVQKQNAKGQRRIEEQTDPNKNPKEREENGNPAPGAFPQNSKKYLAEGKQLNKTDKYGQSIRMDKVEAIHKSMYERGVSSGNASPNMIFKHADSLGFKDITKNEVIYATDTYSFDSIEKSIKGVHTESHSRPGTSDAGEATRIVGSNKNLSNPTKRGLRNAVVSEHKKVIQENRDIKPNLPKSEEEMEKSQKVGDKTKDGLVVLKVPKDEPKVKAHLVGDSKPGMHPASQIGSKIPPMKKAEEMNKGFGDTFANAAVSGSITPAKIQEGARNAGGRSPASVPAPSPTPIQKMESATPAAITRGPAKLAKFMEDSAASRLKKS